MKLEETIYVMCRESQSDDIKICQQAQKEENYKEEIQMMIYNKL